LRVSGSPPIERLGIPKEQCKKTESRAFGIRRSVVVKLHSLVDGRVCKTNKIGFKSPKLVAPSRSLWRCLQSRHNRYQNCEMKNQSRFVMQSVVIEVAGKPSCRFYIASTAFQELPENVVALAGARAGRLGTHKEHCSDGPSSFATLASHCPAAPLSSLTAPLLQHLRAIASSLLTLFLLFLRSPGTGHPHGTTPA